MFTMAEVEVKLDEPGLARGYLEAAARLKICRSVRPSPALGEGRGPRAEAGRGRGLHGLRHPHAPRAEPRAPEAPRDAVRARGASPGLSESTQGALSKYVALRTLAPEEMLVTEGDPSQNVFVVQSGLLGVWLRKAVGRLVAGPVLLPRLASR